MVPVLCLACSQIVIIVGKHVNCGPTSHSPAVFTLTSLANISPEELSDSCLFCPG